MHDPWSTLANVLLTEGIRTQLDKSLSNIPVKVVFSEGDKEFSIIGSHIEDGAVVLVIDAKPEFLFVDYDEDDGDVLEGAGIEL